MAGHAYINASKTKIKHIQFGNTKIKRAVFYNNGFLPVWSGSNPVTYRVDSNVTYTEEKDEGASCLTPTTFTPTKSGWTFLGWREDSTASSNVLSSKVMGDSPITLYAVFRQTITVTYYNNSSSASTTSGYRYYNNGNVVNPTFNLSVSSVSGWTVRGWSTSSGSSASITYNSGSNFARDSNITLYASWSKSVTLSYRIKGTTNSTAKTAYRSYNGTVTNPTFTVSNPTLSGATFKGWSVSSSSTSIAYSSISNRAFASNTTVYAVWTYADSTAMSELHTYQIATTYDDQINTINILNVDTSKYDSAVVRILAMGDGGSWFTGGQSWAKCCDTILRYFVKTVGVDSDAVEQEGYPCYGDTTATVTVTPVNGKITLSIWQMYTTDFYIWSITLKGKTVVY